MEEQPEELKESIVQSKLLLEEKELQNRNSAKEEQPLKKEESSQPAVQETKMPASAPIKKNSEYIMNPEDIAALIANTESEILPETTEKFEIGEKPPLPDMSDPNRPMGPEDIAALIANL